ncbi:MAG: TetR/AcrR family transcriptional regulator [Clostridium sp.]|uniref:TetR/AcrR family transcriptional regulator n=1 Tax=Clostridium sp. TaxID=1506 RepID=UPI0025C6790B|nr:TetR/AcrR family transcriptional regulator [Clostridium sp.]MCH3963362.1 TetR/AcrR family transcriptional regulator [Clostridium sp.]MCI1716770.1 TetR/AcrR family transcriptional regulator [Clostridium sp.]MCI1801046.1 TetR/AcrR family transcriptional regulator [Clostridium sp.]MCI1814956.1 TetR/AcrR family transcriptional regulator [Clostridium sp.]MCI1871857.1 TetR/AcrR family transcriptional regulator [Clostridium sp.]
MGINERREKEKEIRRKDIIEAAERIFFAKGYDNTTMDDVAKEAEFSKRTVYVYFNSKEQIYFEVMTRGYKLLIDMLQKKLKEGEKCNAIGEIKRMALIIYKFSNDYPEYFDAIMEYENGEMDFQKGIPDQSREECYALGEKILGYLTGTLKKGILEKSILSDLDVVKTALVLWACMLGVYNTANKKKNYIENYHGTKPEELISFAFELIMRSIKTANGGIVNG